MVAIMTAGCRTRPRPAATRLWLGPSDGCVLGTRGEVACWGKHFDPHPRIEPVADVADGPLTGTGALELAIDDSELCILHNNNVRCRGGVKIAHATRLASDGHRACAIAGDVRCWWEGHPPSSVFASFAAASVAVGPHDICITDERNVRCIGDAGTPRVVAVGSASSLTVGDEHGCALVEKTAMCWGQNDDGQLGVGTSSPSATAIAVRGLAGAVALRAGSHHTCALLRNGTVSCWGKNDAHQLANGGTSISRSPVPVFGLVGVDEIAAAGDSTCARMHDGQVRCWGRNEVGQIGVGPGADRAEVVVPTPLRDW